MPSDKAEFKDLDNAIYEAKRFIEEAEEYKKKRNTKIETNWGGRKETYYDECMNEHGTLVHRSIILAKYLVKWRK